MKFSRVFRESARFWPATIDISDGELREGGGGYFPILSKACTNAEDYALSWSEWHQVMVWAIFCGLHKQAVQAFGTGQKIIHRDEMDKSYVEFKFSESIFAIHPSYPRQIRRAYVNDLPQLQSA
jgi:hypothetical protein